MNELSNENTSEQNIVMVIEDKAPSAEGLPEPEESGYRRMCIDLYAYRLGTINFLELLQRFEHELDLPSPPTTPHITLE